MPSAIGRSKDGPSFLMSAGARLIVVRPSGNLYPDVLSAVLTRSRDSRTAASGSPTITTTVSPHPENTSTSTTNASMPLTAAEHTLANTGSGYAGIYRELQCANLRFWNSEIACGARLRASVFAFAPPPQIVLASVFDDAPTKAGTLASRSIVVLCSHQCTTHPLSLALESEPNGC